MTAFAIHLPQRREISRWTFAALAVVLAHAALFASFILWQTHQPAESPIVPAVEVSLLPLEPRSAEIQTQDVAVGPETQEAEVTRKVPPKEETQIEKLEPP